MSAPGLWIFLPIIIAGILLLVRNQKVIALIASLLTFILTLAGWFLPIDTAIKIGALDFKVASSVDILGRHLILNSTSSSLLTLLFGSATIWFAVTPVLRTPRRMVPLGLAILALMVAALAVEPFLYAALLIEMSVLLSIPMLEVPSQKPARGVLRFLIFQTLPLPFILFSGWLLVGIEANPGGIGLVQPAAILIGFGFAFLLAVFPFHSWIPLIAEESSPYTVGYLLWIFPTVTLFFGLGFLDHYTWLREAPALDIVLKTVGLIMVVSGGFLAAFQNHLGRILGYAVIMETGVSLLTLSLGGILGMNIFLMLFIPRLICLVLWTMSLTILKGHSSTLLSRDVRSTGRLYPYATTGIVLATLALAGMPILAGFPPHFALWEGLASTSLTVVFWALLGNLGLIFCGLRVLITFATAPKGTRWESRESPVQRIVLVVGFLALVLLGLFPQWAQVLWTRLPGIFTHLGN
jgi:NADH-quinone oxidoreductase subunit N